jgi:flagellar protein FlaG
MSMQVAPLITGGSSSAAVQKEQKPPPLPIEQREASANVEEIAGTSSPDTQQKSQTTDLKQTVSDLSLAFDRRLKFEIDQDSKQLIVKVIDNETDKVIRVLPPEELQRFHHRMRETMGFLFDRMV